MAQNPFRLRASEQATIEDQFLSLVGPDVLDLLPRDQLWDRLLIIESAPGAGKTTILRLFTPASLRLVDRLKEQDAYRRLAEQLTDIGALTDTGPAVVGILVSCREQYATIQDLPIDEHVQSRWFFGLLDARITLLTLRSILALYGLSYPRDAHRVEFRPNDNATVVVEPINGAQLYEKASRAEINLTDSLNSLMGVTDVSTDLSSGLQLPSTLHTSDIFVDGARLTQRILLMFDDVHELTLEQRQALRRDLERRELTIARWLAQRSEAVESTEQLAFARTEGRDYSEIRIEEWARTARRGQRYLSLLDEISNRRILRAQVGVENLESCLMTTLSTDRELERARQARTDAKQQAIDGVNGQQKFDEWVQGTIDADLTTSDSLQAAIEWRKLSITMGQRVAKSQLPLDIPLSVSELQDRDSASMRTAAELFIAKEHRLPFYYGIKRIRQLSSWNIEQFLRVAGDLFEQVLASVTLSRGSVSQLTATQQDTLIRAVSRHRLDVLPKEVPYGGDVRRLVTAIGEFCQLETYRPNAPYAPGVTGVGISESDVTRLREAAESPKQIPLQRLSRVLASAIANNVLEVRPNVNVKGGVWTVFFLNRLYCPEFELPLEYSGYKERVGIDQLALWTASGLESRTLRLHQ